MRPLTAPITGVEMSIINQPKVATEEIAFGSQISGKTKDVATLKSSRGGSQCVMYQSDNVVLGQRNAAIICRHFPSSLLLADIF